MTKDKIDFVIECPRCAKYYKPRWDCSICYGSGEAYAPQRDVMFRVDSLAEDVVKMHEALVGKKITAVELDVHQGPKTNIHVCVHVEGGSSIVYDMNEVNLHFLAAEEKHADDA